MARAAKSTVGALFGPCSANSIIASATQPSNSNVAIVTNDDLRKMRGDIEKTGKGATREAAVLTQADIKRMKQLSVVTSERDAANQKRIFEEQKAQQQAAAKARKMKMQAMDRDRSKKLPPTEIEVDQN